MLQAKNDDASDESMYFLPMLHAVDDARSGGLLLISRTAVNSKRVAHWTAMHILSV